MTEWQTKKLGVLAEVLRGSTITRKEVTPGEVPVIAGGQTPSCYHNVSNREGKTITVSASGAYAGFVQYFEIPIFASDCSTIKVKDENQISSKFLFYMLQASQTEIYAFQRGSGQPHVYPSQLVGLDIPIPPIEEQHNIVEILEDHLSRLDAVLADLKYVRALNQNLVNSYLNRNLTDSQNNWEIRSLGECAELVEYGTSTKTTDKVDDSYIPVLRMGNIQAGILDWTSLKYLPSDSPEIPKLLLMSGDLLFNRTNSAELVGKSAVFDLPETKATFASYLIRVRFKENTNPYWANFIINSGYGRAYINSVVTQQVGQANVNGSKLKNFPLPSPPREVQDILVAEHLEIVERANRIESTIKSAALQGEALRLSLLSAAFTGQLTNEVVNV